MARATQTRDRSQYERLLDDSDSNDCEHVNSADRRDVAIALPLRRTSWLRRADAVCLAVMGVVACYVAVWQPAMRTENPFLLPHVREHLQPQQPHEQTVVAPSMAAHASSSRSTQRAAAYKYMTYADIGLQQRQHGYTVAATARGFEIDGRQTLLLGGSIHYPRSSSGMWRDLLLKAKHDGLNHVQMYVFWNLHEQERGVWDFAGDHNVTQFYELAAELGLFLHVRFGPYVCAEWANGGLPVWLNWVPGMRVRSNNDLWRAEMARFVTHMVAMARPFLASNGGPIILAQIENEFTMDDPAYVAWCGALVKELNTSIPWVMCNGKAATNTIRACNADDCVAFAVDQTRDRPSEPLVWTENEGWFQTWQEQPDEPRHDNDQRSASNVAYAVARWFAVGGASQNYYMYHGGNNYGRAASAGVTTMYADGVNLHADGLSNEPKRSHLRKLHEALIRVNDILLASPRQLPFPKPLTPSSDANASLRHNSHSAAAVLSELPQRAFVYTNGDNEVGFLENAVDAGVRVEFYGATYYLPPRSVVVVANRSRVLFNTSDVAASFPHAHHRVYTPVVDEQTLRWQTWSELLGARGVARKTLVGPRPLEQLRATRDRTDYLTYETSFRLRRTPTPDSNVTLTVTTCDANSIVVFLNHRYVGEQHLGYPGGNCSQQLVFRLPFKTDATDEADNGIDAVDEGEDDAEVQKHYRLTLVSVSLGIYSLGHDHKKGLTGAVRINDMDLANSSSGNNTHWKMLPGLVGEQLELYDPLWTHSVAWKPVPHFNASRDRVKFPLMAWYMTRFALPETARPTPRSGLGSESPIEEVSSILLDCIGLTRGRAYVNGRDLGRYWLLRDAHDQFVQRYYHVPTDWLYFDNATANVVVVFDELGGSVASVRLVLSTIVENPEMAASAPVIASVPTRAQAPVTVQSIE